MEIVGYFPEGASFRGEPHRRASYSPTPRNSFQAFTHNELGRHRTGASLRSIQLTRARAPSRASYPYRFRSGRSFRKRSHRIRLRSGAGSQG